jgi:hypothetical protein
VFAIFMLFLLKLRCDNLSYNILLTWTGYRARITLPGQKWWVEHALVQRQLILAMELLLSCKQTQQHQLSWVHGSDAFPGFFLLDKIVGCESCCLTGALSQT